MRFLAVMGVLACLLVMPAAPGAGATTPALPADTRFRWTDGPKDPVFGIEDPDAGAWFRKTALQMANNAIPASP